MGGLTGQQRSPAARRKQTRVVEAPWVGPGLPARPFGVRPSLQRLHLGPLPHLRAFGCDACSMHGMGRPSSRKRTWVRYAVTRGSCPRIEMDFPSERRKMQFGR